MSDRKRYPWDKTLVELTKYDWLIAIGLHRAHMHADRDLRIANILMQKADGPTCCVWPTQETIAMLSGVADERQVRTTITRLVKSGAITKRRVADMADDMIDALKGKMDMHKDKRGSVYTLKLFWAYETFEAYINTKRVEPAHLRAARENNRTTPVRYNRTTPVRNKQDSSSPPNTTSQNYHDTGRGNDRDQDLASTREETPMNDYSKAKGRAA